MSSPNDSPVGPAATASAAAAVAAAAPIAAASTATSSATASAASAAGALASTDMSKYGTHSCTCDGCNINPIVGFRYKCTKCKDHDICENCFAQFQKGILPHVNKLNNVPRDPSAHAFSAFVDGKAFSAMAGAVRPQPKVNKSKVKPNDPCPCASGKKYKKCCWAKEQGAK